MDAPPLAPGEAGGAHIPKYSAMGPILILGGARSGKSRRALALAEAMGGEPVIIATAEPLDEEMRERILRHRAERSPRWRCIEAPLALTEALDEASAPERVVVVDCLTLWLTNIMLASLPVQGTCAALVGAVSAARGPLVLVSNEVGLGLVPETPLGRAFRDAQGRLNQDLAAVCATVEFVAAGLPLRLKG